MKRSLRHVFGLSDEGVPPVTPEGPISFLRPQKRTSHRLLLPTAPPPPRPPAPFPRPPRHRSTKTSLGYISTPLISQRRKRPTGGRRPTFRASPRPLTIHATKPPTEFTSTAVQHTTRLTTAWGRLTTAAINSHMYYMLTQTTHQPTNGYTSTTAPKDTAVQTDRAASKPTKSKDSTTMSQNFTTTTQNLNATTRILNVARQYGNKNMQTTSQKPGLVSLRSTKIPCTTIMAQNGQRDTTKMAENTKNVTSTTIQKEPYFIKENASKETSTITSSTTAKITKSPLNDISVTTPKAFSMITQNHNQDIPQNLNDNTITTQNANKTSPTSTPFLGTSTKPSNLAPKVYKEETAGIFASSSLLSSSSSLSSRKSKPRWSPVSIIDQDNQSVANGNWTDPVEAPIIEYSSGSEPFMYDLGALADVGDVFSLYDFDYTLDEQATIESPSFALQETQKEQMNGSHIQPQDIVEAMTKKNHSRDELLQDQVHWIVPTPTLTATQSLDTNKASFNGQASQETTTQQEISPFLHPVIPHSSPYIATIIPSSLGVEAFIKHFLEDPSDTLVPLDPPDSIDITSPNVGAHIDTEAATELFVQRPVVENPSLHLSLGLSASYKPLESSQNRLEFSSAIPLVSPVHAIPLSTPMLSLPPSLSSTISPIFSPLSETLLPSLRHWSTLVPQLPHSDMDFAHNPTSDRDSKGFQMPLLPTVSLLSNLQNNTSSLSHAQMSHVEGTLPPVQPILPIQETANVFTQSTKSQLISSQFNRHSDLTAELGDVLLDQIMPSIPVEKLVFSATSTQETEIHDSDLSNILWPSSNGPTVSVSEFLHKPSERHSSSTYPSLDEIVHHSGHKLASTVLPRSGNWDSSEHLNIDRKVPLNFASLSPFAATSSFNILSSTVSPFFQHLDSLSLTPSAAIAVQVDRLPEEVENREMTAQNPSLSNPVSGNVPPVVNTSLFELQNRHNLTSDKDLWRLWPSVSQLTPSPRGHTLSHTTLLNPSIAAQTHGMPLDSSPQLGSAGPQRAPGLDYTHISKPAYILTPTREKTSENLYASGKLDTIQEGPNAQIPFASNVLSTANLFSLSPTLKHSDSLIFPSANHHTHSPSSASPLAPTVTPYTHLFLALQSIRDILVPLSPTQTSYEFLQPTLEIQSFPDMPIHADTKQPGELDSAMSWFSVEQAFRVLGDKLQTAESLSSHSPSPLERGQVLDENRESPQRVNNSDAVNLSWLAPISPTDLSINFTSKRKQISAVFDLADVVPKIHSATHLDEESSEEAVASFFTESSQDTATKGHQMDKTLTHENTQTSAPWPTFAASHHTSSAGVTKPSSSPVYHNPLLASGLNIPPFSPSSIPHADSYISGPHQDHMPGMEDLPSTGNNSHTAKHTFKSNVTTILTHKYNTTNIKNGSSLLEIIGTSTGSKTSLDTAATGGTLGNISKWRLDYSGGSEDSSSSEEKAASLSRRFTTTKRPASSQTVTFKAVVYGGLKMATSSPPKPSTVESIMACQCKQRFHFTCLCGLSPGNRM